MNGSFTSDALSALRARADALIEIGRCREAIPILQNALRIAPDDARLHCRMANALLKMGDQKQALQAADRAIAADPTEEWGHRLRCIILLDNDDSKQVPEKDITQILKAAEDAVSLAPNKIQPLYTLTCALLDAGKISEAQKVAEHLRQVAPQSSWAYEALALVCLRQQRWQDSETHCRAALALDPCSYSAIDYRTHLVPC